MSLINIMLIVLNLVGNTIGVLIDYKANLEPTFSDELPIRKWSRMIYILSMVVSITFIVINLETLSASVFTNIAGTVLIGVSLSMDLYAINTRTYDNTSKLRKCTKIMFPLAWVIATASLLIYLNT